jgi:N-acetyl-beta-hexosaminidase
MTILEIVLLIIGFGLCVGSFFVSERLSEKDRENLTKLTKEQIEEIIKDKMADAKVETEDKLSATIDSAMEELDRRTDKETNEKILEISQYSDTVLESVDKSHKEVTFMYSMLNEKHQAMVEMTKKLAELEDKLVALDASVSNKLSLLKDKELDIEEELNKLAEAKQAMEEASKPEKVEAAKTISFTEALAQKFSEENQPIKANDNMEILALADEGLSDVEIAKKLGRGLGEVKFVIGLYQEGR